MTPKGAVREPQTIDGVTLALVPTPQRRKAQLDRLEGVRREVRSERAAWKANQPNIVRFETGIFRVHLGRVVQRQWPLCTDDFGRGRASTLRAWWMEGQAGTGKSARAAFVLRRGKRLLQ